ncbi:MAG TPA: HNH endonuclease [Candidatus Faecousia intestinigallinarum]|nr:HNH endonuclease [Candidatus Faecousia intestinigallinarum]
MANYRDTYFGNNPGNHGWYTCVRCGRKLRRGDVDIDHIIPQSRGGADGEWNLQCMCRHCNRSKQGDTRDTVPDLIRSTGRIVSRESKKTPFSRFLSKK